MYKVLSVLAVLILPVAAIGTTWHVAVDGDDVGGDGSEDQPFATIQHAVDVAAPGDTVEVYQGTYVGDGNRAIDLGDKYLTIRSRSGDPADCVLELGGMDGISFGLNVDSLLEGPRIEGISFRNGDTALWLSGDDDDWEIANVIVESCRFENNNRGAIVYVCSAEIMDCCFTGNAFGGLSLHYSLATVAGSRFEQNRTGLYFEADGYYSPNSVFSGCTFVHNDTGAVLIFEVGLYQISSCSFESNTGDGLWFVGADPDSVVISDLVSRNNGGNGLVVEAAAELDLIVAGSLLVGNGGNGFDHTSGVNCQFTDVLIAENGGYGLYTNDPGGYTDTMRLTRCEVRDNVLGGVRCLAAGFVVDQCIIVNNGGMGLRLGHSPGASVHPVDITNTIVAGNAGMGLWSDLETVLIANVIIASNEGISVELPFATNLPVSCTDIHANTGGDWTPFPELENVDGNFSADPLFCAPDLGEFQLQDFSPCAPGNHPDGADCGLIGALPAGCTGVLALPYYEDFDDGAADHLEVISGNWAVDDGSYRCFIDEAGTKNLAVVGYATWTDYRASMDILVDGAPTQEFLFRFQDLDNWYRFVIRTAPDNRAEIWKAADGVEDLLLEVENVFNDAGIRHRLAVEAEGEVIRAFVDGDYIFQVVDNDNPHLHGRVALSATADPPVGWQEASFDRIAILPIDMPIAARDVIPSIMRLVNYPNPFNPSTQVVFTMPSSGRVHLAVYDIRGRLVCTLLDEDLVAGRHEVVWDGRDESGRRIASGAYFCRLEAGGFGKTARMALVK